MDAKQELFDKIISKNQSDCDASYYMYEIESITHRLLDDAYVTPCAPRGNVSGDADALIFEAAYSFDPDSPGGSAADYITYNAQNALAEGYYVEFPQNWSYLDVLSKGIDDHALYPDEMHERYGF